jgi:hypothetical protein
MFWKYVFGVLIDPVFYGSQLFSIFNVGVYLWANVPEEENEYIFPSENSLLWQR